MENEFKGTKGNWELNNPIVKENDSGIRFSSIIRKGITTHIIANVYSVTKKDEEIKSNAQLISKAPKMLEMLKELVSENTRENTFKNKKEKALNLIKEATTL